MKIADVEIRIMEGCVRICDVKSGQLLQEDFENKCMRCPARGKTIPTSVLVRMVQAAQANKGLLHQTLAEAAILRGGGAVTE